MPAPIIWGGLALAGIYGLGWAAKETGEAADSLSNLSRYAIVAGGLYVSYRALQAGGVVK
ncbi:hypothetical protein [Yoonia sp.]|uniref:hypothetical protein n=1 Tax=Yoonia sp. TaxID=2212373 RepID=UPI002DFBF2CB|nr:hypothetical protein [Yoonia sp.]